MWGNTPGQVSLLWVIPVCLFISYGWMLPNTANPWIAFHRDAWVATGMSLAVLGIVYKVKERTPWHPITLATAAVAFIPLLQLQFGLLPFAGIAWISTAYVLGFLLAMLSGAAWTRVNALQAADALFFTIAVGATLSAYIGLYQWFELKYFGIWVLRPYMEHRAYANLGQPNQLATLIVWGCVACGWALVRGRIRLPVATLWWAYLLVGVAVTVSRTAVLILIVFMVLAWWRRSLWNIRGAKWVMAGLALFFAVVYQGLDPFAQAMGMQDTPDLVAKMAGESRPAIWAMFLDASFERPWAGYGWTQVGMAQMAAVSRHPDMIATTFSQAHNLFIDLILFMGWPLGVAASLGLIAWLGLQLKRVARAEDMLLIFLVVAVGVHAMLELPLHYAYFLLPTGFAIGILNIRNAPPARVYTSRWVYAGVGAVAIALLAVIIVDYLEVEDNYEAMLYEGARIGTLPPRDAPDVLVLTHLREILRMSRFAAKRGMSEEELQWMRDVTNNYNSVRNLHLLALALALNGHKEESQKIVTGMCETILPFQCDVARRAWKASQSAYPEADGITGPR